MLAALLPLLLASPVGDESARRADAACFETVLAIAAGGPLSPEAVTVTPCRSAQEAAVRYDRASRLVLAAEPLAAGAYLGPLPALSPGIAKGANLTLRVTAGAATIEREVTAVQAGRAGQRIFVRDANGAIFAAPLVMAQ